MLFSRQLHLPDNSLLDLPFNARACAGYFYPATSIQSPQLVVNSSATVTPSCSAQCLIQLKPCPARSKASISWSPPQPNGTRQAQMHDKRRAQAMKSGPGSNRPELVCGFEVL